MKKTLINILKIVLFFGLGLAILWFAYQSQSEKWLLDCAEKDIEPVDCGTYAQKIARDFSQVKWGWIFAVLFVYVISNVSRAARWIMLLKPLGYRPRFLNAFFTVMIGYFANLGFPRIGEILRPTIFAGYEKMPVEKVLGTIVTERVIDVICLLIVFALTFALEFERLWNFVLSFQSAEESTGMPLMLKLTIAALVVVIVAAFFIYKNREKIAKNPFAKKILDFLMGLWEGVQTIRQMKNPLLFIFHSVNIWFMYFLMTYLGFFAFAPTEHLTLLAGLVVFVTGALGIVIPTPGGLGSYNVLVTAALVQFYNINGNDAFSFSIILFFSINVGCNILLGLLGMIFLPLYNRKYEPNLEGVK